MNPISILYKIAKKFLMKKGDIVLLPFPYTDLSGYKFRPSVILLSTPLSYIVAFVTSKIYTTEQFDISIMPDKSNGLKLPSLIRLNKIATIDKSLAKGMLGKVSDSIIDNIQSELKKMFNL